MVINKLTVTITKTSTGIGEYIQVISDDQISVNVVCIADKIEVKDCRCLQDKIESKKE